MIAMFCISLVVALCALMLMFARGGVSFIAWERTEPRQVVIHAYFPGEDRAFDRSLALQS